MQNSIKRITDKKLFYDVDTSGGQSGSGICIEGGMKDLLYVISIHTHGVMPGEEDYGNSGVRLTRKTLRACLKTHESD